MEITARQMADRARASMKALAVHPEYGSLRAVYEEISAHSGLSTSFINKFVDGSKPNPTAATLDKMIFAVKQATQRAAA